MRRERAYAWAVDHPSAVDAVFAALLFLVWGVVAGAGDGRLLLVSLAVTAPLVWRRTRPVLSGAAVLGVAGAQWGHSLVAGSVLLVPADAAVLVALYSVAAYGPRWASRLALASGYAGASALALDVQSGPFDLALFLGTGVAAAAVVTAAWALGDLRGIRRASVVALAERARLLELEREQEARLAAADERARIAREMHDVVAHSLSVVIAQADGGRYAARHDPAKAEAALETVATTGRAALADMRRLLGVLREDGGAVQDAPQPSVSDVPALLESVRSSGVDARLEVAGAPGELSAGAGLAAYRIVQESLTNVLKHAGTGVRVVVALRWEPDVLRIEVADDGGLPRQGRASGRSGEGAGAPNGHGLVGMRERARLYGGAVRAGRGRDGGFVVSATLPCTADLPA